MDLTLDEHKLITEFRKLNPAGRKELLDYALLLLKKCDCGAEGDQPEPQDRCPLDHKEERPETAKEPIFTE